MTTGPGQVTKCQDCGKPLATVKNTRWNTKSMKCRECFGLSHYQNRRGLAIEDYIYPDGVVLQRGENDGQNRGAHDV